jgi:hypothetical protein
MEKVISCCGLNCATCDARIATLSNDNELRKATAEKWRAMFNPDITAEMINCTGCREEGVKFSHCNMCQIRSCVAEKSFNTCADCDKMDSCELVAGIHKAVPECIQNLRELKN